MRGGVRGLATSAALISATRNLARIGEDYLKTADRRPSALRSLIHETEKLEAVLAKDEVR